MEFRKVLALRGPNVWASFPVMEAWVDLGERKDVASSEIPGCNERLMSWLPSLIEHRCSVGERGGFFERLRRGTYLAHILEHVSLELQNLTGAEVGFGRARASAQPGVYKVVVEYEEEEVARAALEVGRQLVLAAIEGKDFDVAGEVGKLRALRESLRLDPVTEAIVEAARRRDIPRTRLEQSLVQLGHGASQHRVWRGQTDAVSALGNYVADSGWISKKLLQNIGAPVEADDAPTKAVANIRVYVVNGRALACAELPTGTMQEVDQTIHPETLEIAVDAARVVGLETGCVDIAAPDLAASVKAQGGVVVAVSPRLELPTAADGKRHKVCATVADAVIDQLFPEENPTGRIPVVGVTGVNGKTTTTRLTAHLLAQTGACVGMTCTEGIFIGSSRIASGDCSGPASAGWVLQHPRAQAAVLETARGGIVRAGLGFDRCDVAVVTNIGEGDHLGISEIDTLEQLAYVKSTLVAAVSSQGTAVLRADDKHVVDMAQWCKGAILYFALGENDPVIREHRQKGGKAAFVRHGHIILAEGVIETTLIALDEVPLTHGGRVNFQVLNCLSAAAAAWCMGVTHELIAQGLRSFSGNLDNVPGRFNLLKINGATVVVDYGHNISALECVVSTLDQFPHPRRSIVFSGSGDRRECDLIRQGEILGAAFDRVILYEDPRYLRGAQEGRMSALFRQGLSKSSRVKEVIEERSWAKAVQNALEGVNHEDLLVIQPDIIDETVEMVRSFLKKDRAGGEVGLSEAIKMPEPEPDAFVTTAPGLDIRDCKLGVGVFTTQAFSKGQQIMRGWGPRVPERSRHSMQVDTATHVVPPPPIVYLNHSCEPNCGVLIRNDVPEMEIHALRSIAPGEQLTLDYATFEEEIRGHNGSCMCGAAGCRGTIHGYSELPKRLRDAYGPYIASYLRRKEAPVVEPELVGVAAATVAR